MKFKRSIIILFSFIVSVVALLAGCTYSKVKSVQGSYELDLYHDRIDSRRLSSVVKSATISIDRLEAYLSIETTEQCEEITLKSGYYSVDYEYAYSDSVDGRLTNGDNEIIFSCFNDTIELFVNVKYKLYGNDDFNNDNFWLYFIKVGGTAEIPDHNPDTDNKPNPEPAGSNFEKIKTAYKNAGYSDNLAADESLDASVKQLVTTMQQQYAALGYNIAFIGKNLSSDAILNAEIYMLISTPTESEAVELQRNFEGVYQCARSGRDLIIYIWALGTPNFTCFNQATQ